MPATKRRRGSVARMARSYKSKKNPGPKPGACRNAFVIFRYCSASDQALRPCVAA
jgi:hypothetical protein